MIFSWWDEMHKDAEGLALLKDWLGEGGQPVPHSVAESRAAACVRGGSGGVLCPFNQAENWWEKVKDIIARTIKKTLEWKNRIGLKTSEDDSLMMCVVCGCCTRLKVWVPLKHVEAHTPQEQRNLFPSHCWIRKELEAKAA